MAVNYKDLPPKAKEQVAQKMLMSQRGRAATPAEPDSVKTKYGNKKAVRVMTDGREIVFDSQKEARRYDELTILLQTGVISELKLQPEFTLQEPYTTPDGYRIRAIRYRADFSYKSATGRFVVEDVKSKATKTREYEIKKKLMRERHGILIREV